MHPIVQTILILSLIIIASTLVVGALDLRQIRLVLAAEHRKGKKSHLQLSAFSATDVVRSKAGYAIYAFRGGRWVLEADFSNPGYEPASVSMPGSYEGQVIKKESALQAKG
jgi:hypothetical protein